MKKFDIIKALSAAGYPPSDTVPLSLTAWNSALTAAYGQVPTVQCSGGNVATAVFCVNKALNLIPCPSVTTTSTCSGTWYLPQTKIVVG